MAKVTRFDMTNIPINKRLAIIYSIDDIGHYLVEIKYQNNSYYISHHGNPIQYGNLSDARVAAHSHNADVAVLALSKTFAEVDVTTDHEPAESACYDYMPIEL